MLKLPHVNIVPWSRTQFTFWFYLRTWLEEDFLFVASLTYCYKVIYSATLWLFYVGNFFHPHVSFFLHLNPSFPPVKPLYDHIILHSIYPRPLKKLNLTGKSSQNLNSFSIKLYLVAFSWQIRNQIEKYMFIRLLLNMLLRK